MLKYKMFAVLYALSTRFYVELVGRLMLAELVALMFLPFFNIPTLIKKNRILRQVLSILLVLLLAQVVSDLVNVSSPADFLRGWAVIVFATLSLLYLVKVFSANINSVVFYLLALFVIRLLFGDGEVDFSIVKDNSNYFKQRFVSFLNPGILVVGYYLFLKRRFRLTSVVLIIFGMICIYFDARSNGLISIVAGVLLYAKCLKVKFTGVRIVWLAIMVTVIAYSSYLLYANLVLYHGIGGGNARSQFARVTNPANPFELLYYGRPEIGVLVEASLDKPIFGHGSWGKDLTGKYTFLQAKISGNRYMLNHGYINAHSIILGYQAYAGIAGMVSVLILFGLLFYCFFRVYQSNYIGACLPVLVFTSVNMLWDLFFSPVGHFRTTFPLFASLTIVMYANVITRNKMDENHEKRK